MVRAAGANTSGDLSSGWVSFAVSVILDQSVWVVLTWGISSSDSDMRGGGGGPRVMDYNYASPHFVWILHSGY